MEYKKLDNLLDDESLDAVLKNFKYDNKENEKGYKAITVWVPEEYKIKYGEIQRKSSRTFCKTLRDLILISIDKTISKSE